MKTVVYTAITGRYDKLKKGPATGDEFIAFVDSGIKREVPPWKIVTCDVTFHRPVLTAKWYKMMPHKLFPDCDYSLWVDGSVEMREERTVARLVEEYMGDGEIVLFRHNIRNCIYEEAWECIKKGLDDKSTIYRQVSKYTREGYPSNAGLAEATVLLRKHNRAVNSFNEAWWEEICNHSVRDQISFNFLSQKMGIKVNYFPGTIHGNDLFKKHRHRKKYGKEDWEWLKRVFVGRIRRICIAMKYKKLALRCFNEEFMEKRQSI